MRVAAVALALLLAGCLSPAPAETLDTASLSGAATGVVQAFLADGTPATLQDLVGTATYILTGHDGAEPNIGITASGAVFVTADDHVLRSTDRGTTWEIVYDFVPPPPGAPFDPVGNSDPMLFVDPVTDIVYNDPMFPTLACSSLVSSEDDGETWFERHGVCHPPPMDHQRLGSGLPGPRAPALAGVAHPTVLYQCYNQIVNTVCASSFDGGLDWAYHTVVANGLRDGCAGTNGSPRAGPDGTVVVALWCDDPPLAAFSEDNGLTWRLSELPDVEGPGWGDPSVAWTPDGTVYVSYSDGEYGQYLARSVDKGETWDGPWNLLPPGVDSAVFGAIAVGSDGRLGALTVATRDPVDDPSDAPDDTRWHVYVTTTDTAATENPLFVSYQVTPEDDPVQVGCVWIRGFPGAPCRNMLDFIDAAMAPDGTFFGVYTEGCTEGCAGKADAKPDDSRSREVAVVRLDGWSLLAQGASMEAEATAVTSPSSLTHVATAPVGTGTRPK